MLAKVENPNWEIQDNSQGNKLVTVVQQSPVKGDSLEKTKVWQIELGCTWSSSAMQ